MAENKTPEAAKLSESKPTTSKEVGDAISQAIKEALPVAVAAAVKMSRQPAPVEPEPLAAGSQVGECGTCRQPFGGCGGKHRKIVVGPERDENWRIFPGIAINGVRYLSQGPGHMIDVPADSDIEYKIYMWEQNEQALATPRVKYHNSGQLGPGNRSGFVPATKGWR